LRALGFRTVPVTAIGERAISGFNPNQLSEALQLGVKVAARDPAETLPLLGRVLGAVQRAVRQMPDDKLDWTAPDRDRPMREFAYHIFLMVRNTIRALSTGATPEGADTEGRSYSSFQEIAGFGGTVIDEFKEWSATPDLVTLRAPIPDGSEGRNGAERLDLVAGHSVQHMRQLYFVLEEFGVTVDDRLPDSELPPEYVLTILW
jgi:hypothetical protein